MLYGTGFSNYSLLSHLFGKKNLPDSVVDFMGTGVVKILALEIELAAIALAHSLSKIKR